MNEIAWLLTELLLASKCLADDILGKFTRIYTSIRHTNFRKLSVQICFIHYIYTMAYRKNMVYNIWYVPLFHDLTLVLKRAKGSYSDLMMISRWNANIFSCITRDAFLTFFWWRHWSAGNVRPHILHKKWWRHNSACDKCILVHIDIHSMPHNIGTRIPICHAISPCEDFGAGQG